MTVSANTDFSVVLDDLKQTYGPDLNDYRPNFTILQTLLEPNRDGIEVGAKINLPVCLSHQGGETYDTSGGTATLRAPVSMEIKDASSDQFEVTLPVKMPFGLISKVKQSPKARFGDRAKLILLAGKKGSLRANELHLLHGSNGIGKVSVLGTTNGAGPWTRDVTFDVQSWSDGIWGASDNLPIDWVSALSAGTKRNAGDTNVTAVKGWSTDASTPRTITFTATGASTDLSTIQVGDFAIPASAKDKQMPGLLFQLGLGAAVTHLGISTNYSMWRAKQVTVAGPITMGKLLSGISPAVSHGADGKMSVLCSTRNFADLNKDLSSTRRLDWSYTKGKLQNGAQKIEFVQGDLTLEIVLHPFMKDGEVAAIPVDNWFRVGSDPDPTMALDELKLQVMSGTSNTFEFRFWSAQALMPNVLGTSVFFSGITPNAT